MCLVGRELCLFMTLDASKAPAKQRKEFTALAVRRAAPFPDPEFDAAWAADGTAALWYWSRTKAMELAAGVPGKRKRFVAEALYVAGPQQDGVELLALAEGFEARAWKAGQLQASRWWQELPSPGQWRDFLRGVGQVAALSAAIPEPAATEVSATSWSRSAPGNTPQLQLAGLDQYLPKVALAAVAAFLLVTCIQLGSIARARMDVWRAEAAASDLDAPLKRILDAREASDEAGEEISRLLALHGLRPTISLMAEFTRLMPGKEWQVKKWNQPTQDALEVVVVAPNSNPEELVSTWEASPMFKGVTAELGRNNELTIKATVIPAAGHAGSSTPGRLTKRSCRA